MNFTNFEEVLINFKKYLIKENDGSIHTVNTYYPKIEYTFIPYLKRKKQDYERVTINRFLECEVSDSDIIKSAISDVKRVVESKGSASETAVTNYIIAIRQLFYSLKKDGIQNTNIITLFSQNPLRNSESDALMEQIKINLMEENISLLPPQEYPPLSNNEVSHLLESISFSDWRNCDISKPQSFKKLQSCVLIKLFLLLGISQQKLYRVRIDEYNTLYNQITILGSNSSMVYTITLPNTLSDQLRFLMNFRMSFYNNDIAKAAGELLFVNRNGKSLPESYLFRFLGKIKDDYIKNNSKKTAYDYRDGFNSFTPTGALKYGVTEMLKKGVNPTIIADFTGNGDKIMQDCQEEALSNNYNQSKYLDSFIRKSEYFELC